MSSAKPAKARTLGDLRRSEYQRPSRQGGDAQEPDRQAARRRAIFPGIVGYEETVIPQIENAILSGQDIIFLGERGQAKTRIARTLINLLDDEVADHRRLRDQRRPLRADLRAGPSDWSPSMGDDDADRLDRRASGATAKSWPRPDITIADLIGEVDPIKVAEGRYLSDELTIHYGLLPRTNRGIFCINELPDLAERIQVGLLNIMEERDVQIRGYKVRLPLDCLRGRQRQPGGLHQPRAHHHAAQGPLRLADPHPLPAARSSTRSTSWSRSATALRGRRHRRSIVPQYMKEIVAEITHLARRSPDITQRSGVIGARLDRQLREPAQQRAASARSGSARTRWCRASPTCAPWSPRPRGKIEIESVGDAREDKVIEKLVQGAVWPP